ncbi:MAG: accessory gene regulator B family protein [Clostridium baratii]|uniref:Accessory regulator B family protein n=1 Tax=Clostridium baratii str. Sullivan TaxID=1415775 RepID=A0A0A7FZK2_9CLOT|nr:accessory gene regulator B family protein [Clostridium baratii]AIY85064.1 accessory regulator B family protein [Clostridium baratii str. Sullivan]MBS6006131.1 accessory gene regulator B family protein [Clostridium baratii]MDU1053202.1 accessory gene regulator B family protein [Clostridium baratii]MDU4911269.1 accessory gene regulator B family protein [Clostridium baratii]CUP12023.1 accessory gene regulator B superfamily [Clostridium baratii]
MIDIGELSNKIATKIVVETDGDEERKSVIEYGIFAMIQTGIAIICTVIFGLLFNVLVEALIVSFSISILRKCSGGVHATSPTRCTVIGTIICILIPKLAIIINMNIIYSIIVGIIVFIVSYYIVYKLAPVDSKNKPIKKLERRKKLKRKSINIINIYLIISIVFIMIYHFYNVHSMIIYFECLYLGMLWQVISLTKVGHLTVNKFDYLLNKINI